MRRAFTNGFHAYEGVELLMGEGDTVVLDCMWCARRSLSISFLHMPKNDSSTLGRPRMIVRTTAAPALTLLHSAVGESNNSLQPT